MKSIIRLILSGAVLFPAALQTARAQQMSVSLRQECGADLRMTVVLPQGYDPKQRYPVALFIHGGGWAAGSQADVISWAQEAAKTGLFIGATGDYRLTSRPGGQESPPTPDYLQVGATWPTPFNDLKCALSYLRSRPEANGRIGVMGGSAGGHLALMLGTKAYAADVQAAVAVSGVTDMTDLYTYSQMGPVIQDVVKDLMIAPPQSGLEAWYASASPLRLVQPGMAPVLMVAGTADTVVPWWESYFMDLAVRGVGGHSELRLVAGGGHNVDSVSPQLIPWTLEFFTKTLYLSEGTHQGGS